MIFQGGLYMFTLWDYYSATGLALFWFCFWEGVGFAWGYGAEHIYEHVEDMLGHKINPWLKICWKYVSPFVIMVSSHHSCQITVFENHRKSLIQHCERSELRLHFEWTKVD